MRRRLLRKGWQTPTKGLADSCVKARRFLRDGSLIPAKGCGRCRLGRGFGRGEDGRSPKGGGIVCREGGECFFSVRCGCGLGRRLGGQSPAIFGRRLPARCVLVRRCLPEGCPSGAGLSVREWAVFAGYSSSIASPARASSRWRSGGWCAAFRGRDG